MITLATGTPILAPSVKGSPTRERLPLEIVSPIYAGRMFETLHEQESVATTWLRHTAASFEVLDTLRLLGLRMDVVHRVAIAVGDEVDRRRATIALRRADHASGERVVRTLAGQAGILAKPRAMPRIVARARAPLRPRGGARACPSRSCRTLRAARAPTPRSTGRSRSGL